MGDQVQIQVKFTIQQDGLTFTDALYFGPDEYKKLSDSDIEAMKQERFDNYKATIANARKLPQEQPVEQIASVDDQIESLNASRQTLVEAVAASTGKPVEDIEQMVEKVRAIDDTETIGG